MNQWARDWVGLYTQDTGKFSVSDDEDQGILFAVEELDKLKRVDLHCLLVLCTVSNFTVPPPGTPPNQSLFENLSGSRLPAGAECRLSSTKIRCRYPSESLEPARSPYS